MKQQKFLRGRQKYLFIVEQTVWYIECKDMYFCDIVWFCELFALLALCKDDGRYKKALRYIRISVMPRRVLLFPTNESALSELGLPPYVHSSDSVGT